MSETQRYKVKPANRAIRIDALRDFQKPMVAWWYCGFSAPDKDSHQPKVKVEFRELNDDYTVKPSYTHKNILVSLLGHVTLGSIWQQGFCSWEIQFQNRTCTIPFPVGGWQTIRSADVPGGLFPPACTETTLATLIGYFHYRRTRVTSFTSQQRNTSPGVMEHHRKSDACWPLTTSQKLFMSGSMHLLILSRKRSVTREYGRSGCGRR